MLVALAGALGPPWVVGAVVVSAPGEVADAVPVGPEVAVAGPACVLDVVADGEGPVLGGSARGTPPTAWPMLVPVVVEPETGPPMIRSTAGGCQMVCVRGSSDELEECT